MGSVSLLLQTMLVEHAPGVNRRTDEEEWKAERAKLVGGQHPESDAEDNRAHA